MKKDIEEILNIAVHAPSGNNSQPWKFEVRENVISLWDLPEKDRILFNWQQRGSHVAHGAVIENIVIACSKKGYSAKVSLSPRSNTPSLVAEISLEKGGSYPYEYLHPFIKSRSTNRRKFEKKPLSVEDKNKIEDFFRSLKSAEGEVAYTEDRGQINSLAKAFSVGDNLLFSVKELHKAFFDGVSWTLEEEKKKREGLYVGTKELPPPVKLFFKYVMSRWNLVNFLNRLGFSNKAAKKRESLYKYCSLMGIIISSGDKPENFISAGRILQRLWLHTSFLGLSFQPLSIGLLYLGQRLEKGNVSELSAKQIRDIKEGYGSIIKIFNVRDRTPIFSFRVGYSLPPSAHSIKKAPEIHWL